MLRILTPESVLAAGELAEDVEIVLGRRQLASLSFVVVVALAVASGASYFAGKAAAGNLPPETKSVAVATPPASAAPVSAAPVSNGVPVPTPATSSVKSDAGVNAVLSADAANPSDEAVFGEPVPGAMYIQVGAMDRGPAMILTAGLRKRGFPSVTAHGPSATIFRVLVGPYQNMPEYFSAKESISQMGIAAFGRVGQ